VKEERNVQKRLLGERSQMASAGAGPIERTRWVWLKRSVQYFGTRLQESSTRHGGQLQLRL
jgi:hypothetical protein